VLWDTPQLGIGLALQTTSGTAGLISLAVAFSHPGVLLVGQARAEEGGCEEIPPSLNASLCDRVRSDSRGDEASELLKRRQSFLEHFPA
jgi:hypothetical protein